ncbi:hypothetical protein BP6252_08236 [Coleophoma cylindrospora]|uniref:3-phytase n=1 Tax=Coleophoma cylindrospora TaxID=1849047 RepID=A0A3D8R5E2_9HELO|nr:hypothetical protein BP6252_08236 [Coleophoma cylindrospora]
MSTRSLLKIVASLAVATTASATSGDDLAPATDINFPAGTAGTLEPLHYAGANCPYFPGPDVFDIPYEVPEGCTVQQASYIVRHGSRFPDSGSYNGWVTIQKKIQAAMAQPGFNATGSLAFIPDWHTVLTDTTLQMSQESMTGYKEAHDLGYQLRTRYPDFYEDGNDYMVWANQYAAPINESRVVQTAQAFLQGYLYIYADTYGSVVSINSTASPAALGDSLSPSDMCPAFTNDAKNNVTDFDNTWVPDALTRINSMVSGNLTFDETDILFFPYMCGYESQITGHLSPWCGVFNDTELLNYAYSQDLSYYYGTGPGSSGPASKLFLPYLDEIVSLLMEGPGQQGVGPDGPFTVPNLIMGFMNDNQIAQLTSAMGIFDSNKLPIDYYPGAHEYDISHFITMRGTVAFEVLNCAASAPKASSSATFSSSTTGASAPASTVAVTGSQTASSNGTSATATGSSGTATGIIGKSTGSTATPTGTPYSFTSTGTPNTLVTTTVTASDCAATTTAKPTKPNSGHQFKRRANANETYIRVIFNDVVYPIINCQSGPGNSCLLSDYAAFIHEENEAAGDFTSFCNVTAAGSEKSVVNGASFYTNTTLDFLTILKGTQ